MRMNTELKRKQKTISRAISTKVMNNSVFGKTMENLRNRVDVVEVFRKAINFFKLQQPVNHMQRDVGFPRIARQTQPV